MTARASAAFLSLLVVAGALAGTLFVALPASAGPTPAAVPPLTGNLTGPALVAIGGTGAYFINGSGGPADATGNRTGTITFHASVAASNLTGVSVAPANGTLKKGAPSRITLSAGDLNQRMTITVEVISTFGGSNASINLTQTVQVVRPYVLYATLVAGPRASVLSFAVVVDLDGAPVGTVTVPDLAANATYNLTYSYPTTGLSPGYHTFSISLASEHGLVAFTGGASSYAITFYVASPPTNNAVYYVLGAVAFFGVLFIFGTRVAARRRDRTRR